MRRVVDLEELALAARAIAHAVEHLAHEQAGVGHELHDARRVGADRVRDLSTFQPSVPFVWMPAGNVAVICVPLSTEHVRRCRADHGADAVLVVELDARRARHAREVGAGDHDRHRAGVVVPQAVVGRGRLHDHVRHRRRLQRGAGEAPL